LPQEFAQERSTDPAYNDRYLAGINRPRIAVFRPQKPNGGAALIMPGGGYQRVVIDKEGHELARWLSARGVTCFVLFYRLPGEGWAAGPDVALSDAQRALRLVRARASDFVIDLARVCAMGFSAGGHLCADLLTRFDAATYSAVDAADRLSARPDAAALIYPVISMSKPVTHAGSRVQLLGEDATEELERRHSPHLNVPANAPPTFLIHSEDDGAVPVANTLLMRQALRDKGVATETHLFPDGGHGFGLRQSKGKSVEGWEELLFAWGRGRGLWF
jgi:acetyl esterase/lipase